jgi:hypothetical protein
MVDPWRGEAIRFHFYSFEKKSFPPLKYIRRLNKTKKDNFLFTSVLPCKFSH